MVVVCQQHVVDVLQIFGTPHVAKVKDYKCMCVICKKQGEVKIFDPFLFITRGKKLKYLK
ncbi:hypothetical protein [Neobacillus drentensis]|uniref:hypothetical protein n=1 Tax=Neobacillus drentensis TaxID=220684 RepID=UPI0030023B85